MTKECPKFWIRKISGMDDPGRQRRAIDGFKYFVHIPGFSTYQNQFDLMLACCIRHFESLDEPGDVFSGVETTRVNYIPLRIEIIFIQTPKVLIRGIVLKPGSIVHHIYFRRVDSVLISDVSRRKLRHGN